MKQYLSFPTQWPRCLQRSPYSYKAQVRYSSVVLLEREKEQYISTYAMSMTWNTENSYHTDDWQFCYKQGKLSENLGIGMDSGDSTSLHFRGLADEYANKAMGGSSAQYHTSRLEARCKERWVRFATVILYVLCVSLSAVVLALYYSIFWHPQPKMINTATGNGENFVDSGGKRISLTSFRRGWRVIKVNFLWFQSEFESFCLLVALIVFQIDVQNRLRFHSDSANIRTSLGINHEGKRTARYDHEPYWNKLIITILLNCVIVLLNFMRKGWGKVI